MPTDLLRDEQTGRLKLPVGSLDITPAERELYSFLNSLEGWPASSVATVEFTGIVAERSVNPATIQVWARRGGVLSRFGGARLRLESTGQKLSVEPPDEGWPRGSTMLMAVLGGPSGLRGARGEPVECDSAFYYLRLKEPLDRSLSDFRAFPGATRAEREQAARDLEAVRLKLAPSFQELEQRGISRHEVAALWTFTVNDYTEVMMDKASGRMPLPSDLLLDETTGKVDLPERATDSAKEREAKRELRVFDGFSTTASQLFEFSRPVDPSTVNEDTVELYRVSDGARLPAKVTLSREDLTRVMVTPAQVPLEPRTTYAVVVRPGIVDSLGKAVRPMLVGHFLKAAQPLMVGDKKQVASLDLAASRKLEWVRRRMASLMDRLGRDRVLAAWPFTTMSIVEPLLDAVASPERLALPPDPVEVQEKSVAKAVLDFPLGIASLIHVDRVVEGKITVADFLDPATRRPYSDGSHRRRLVPFTMTIPAGAKPESPLPVVIFGHAICTERRFVLAVADALAKRGFAAISIDLPYHGTRSACAWDGPMCFPDPLSKEGKMLCPDPCKSGSTCGKDGQCRDAQGNVTPLATWPLIGMPQASGAAFIEISTIPGTMAHFRQAVLDLMTLSRSLRKGNWKESIGLAPKTDEVFYLGQSLGGIVGGTYAALDPAVTRAVLNVPGGNLVPMFQESKYFGAHIDAYLEREKIVPQSAEYDRFMLIARWFMDAVDPLNVAEFLVRKPLPGRSGNARAAMIQMAKLDFIIPNASTQLLAATAGVPRRDYVAEHAFLVVPVEPAYLPGNSDAAGFLAGEAP